MKQELVSACTGDGEWEKQGPAVRTDRSNLCVRGAFMVGPREILTELNRNVTLVCWSNAERASFFS
jgi:hypothetical protein